MIHPEHVPGYEGDLTKLGKAIADMKYDKIAELFTVLKKEFEGQSEGDEKGGRKQLAEKLDKLAQTIGIAEQEMNEIWKLCEPHMKK